MKRFTSPEDDFESSTVLQAFIQLATRLNCVFINCCLYPWMLPVYRVPGGVEYVLSLLKLELKWITHSICESFLQLVGKYCVLLLFLEMTYKQLRVQETVQ